MFLSYVILTHLLRVIPPKFVSDAKHEKLTNLGEEMVAELQITTVQKVIPPFLTSPTNGKFDSANYFMTNVGICTINSSRK